MSIDKNHLISVYYHRSYHIHSYGTQVTWSVIDYGECLPYVHKCTEHSAKTYQLLDVFTMAHVPEKFKHIQTIQSWEF